MVGSQRHSRLRVLSAGNAYPPHILGGYEVVWRGVIERLRDEGEEARVLTTDYRSPQVAPEAPDDPDVYRDLRWYWRDHEWPRIGFRDRLALERHNAAVFDRHLEEFRPHVVTWWPLGGMSLGLVERARRAGLPSVLFVHDYWPNYGPERDLWTRGWARMPLARAVAERLTGLPTRPQLAEAGRWLFNSEVVREDTERAGLQVRDWDILSPGIEPSLLTLPREATAPPWRWRLLYVGRVVEQKGVATAIEALRHLPDEATLRIVGDGDSDYRRGLTRLADRLGVSARVQFEPSCPHEVVVDVYRSADAVLFPVLWPEPWGLVPLEAMAAGRPVVATGRGGSADFLRDRQNALLFRGGDAQSLAAAVSSLESDPSLREQLREGGFATAAAHTAEAFDRRAAAEIRAAAARSGD